jgi:NAD(P)-dependent dehydrogenase (short-subunit alcohol dehydrogenase family)
MRDLAGKVAVVTGAGSGIGLALASSLSSEGMRVVISDVDERALDRAAAVLVDGGAEQGDVLAQRCDVRLDSEVGALADLVFATWGQVDVLCNNAGVFVGGLLWEQTTADLEFVLGVNVWGILNGIRAFVPRMLAQDTEGHIVNTCSVAGLLAGTFSGPYCVSKFAALAATESLALDLAMTGSKLKVTALCPGMVQTNLDTGSIESRPPELASTNPDATAFMSQVLREHLDQGIEASDVAAQVLDAIRTERFMALTHPHHIDALRLRTDQLASGALPDPGDYR